MNSVMQGLYNPENPLGLPLRDLAKVCGDADHVAVLCVKDHDRCVEGVAADYIALEVPDRYVYGYGMDYHEQGRNLPGLYALK